MKKIVVLVFILLTGLFPATINAQYTIYRQQAPPSISVTQLEMEGVGYLYYGDHLSNPPEAEVYGSLIKLLYEEMGVEIPSVYKIYILPYEDWENVLAYLSTSNEYAQATWLKQYREQQDTIIYAFIDNQAMHRGELVIYLFEASYPVIVHENLHYILEKLSDNGWMNDHSIIQPLEQAFIGSIIFRNWQREYR